MAAFETPWTSHMSTNSRYPDDGSSQATGESSVLTFAAFAPAAVGGSVASERPQRSTILVHQKSPLLVSTPPQVTRALAYSHPFILPLNKAAALLTWTSGDPWESFLLVAAFWTVTLYGDAVVRWAGPVVIVAALILGMYTRRYSPLSSAGGAGEKGQGKSRTAAGDADPGGSHHKSLDEIVETMKLFTSRCNILLDPFMRLTEFLSTQSTATSATTRPALTTLFIRILLVTPFWFALTLAPLRLITTKRVVLAFGTMVLSWHSRPARISRTIIWRSRTVRRICGAVTGLDIGKAELLQAAAKKRPPLPPRQSQKKGASEIAAALRTKRRAESPGIRFTFTLYENQRRWLGIGWTSNMLAYERAPWTDEHLTAASPKEQFQLPEVEGGHARWRWVKGSAWQVEGAEKAKGKKEAERDVWVYYDNKWKDGRRGQDGWGRYTRRRKWYRDAELVEITPSTEVTPSATPRPAADKADAGNLSEVDAYALDDGAAAASADDADAQSIGNGSGRARRRRWFRRSSRTTVGSGGAGSSGSVDLRGEDEPVHTPLHEERDSSHSWGLGDDASMQLG